MKRQSLILAFCALATFSCTEKASDVMCIPACSNVEVCINGVCEAIVNECADGKVDCKDGAGCVVFADSHRSACDTCLDGYGDCDKDMKNGCELKLDADSHCGGCNVVCDAKQSCMKDDKGFSCHDKVVCTDGKVDCNDGAGCVVLDNDSNCGACGVVCSENQSCQAGIIGFLCVDKDICADGKIDCKDGAGCVVLADSHRETCDTCLDTYGDCDKDMKNGCEIKLDSDNHCGSCETDCKAKNAKKGICASVEGKVHCTITCDPEDPYDSQDFCYEDLTKPDKPGVLLKCVKDDRNSAVYVMAQVANYCDDQFFLSCKRSKDLEEYDVNVQDCAKFSKGLCAPGIGCISDEECSATDVNSCNKKVMQNCVKVGDKYYWQKTNCSTYIKQQYPGKDLEGACSKVDAKTVACEAICENDGTWEFGECEALMSRLAFCNPNTGKARYEKCPNSCTTEVFQGVEKPVCF